MASDYSFSHSAFPPSLTTLTADTLLTKKKLLLKTNHQLMYDQQNYPQTPSFTYSFDSDPVTESHNNWHMFPGQNQNTIPTGFLRKSRGHQRTTSESTVNSTGPSSPYMQTTSFPHIANADQSPSASYYDNDQSFNNIGYVPSKLSHTPAAHLAMQNMAIDHHNSSLNDDIPDFSHSSRHSVSSKGQDSPSTPQPRANEEQDERPPLFKVPTNGESMPDDDLLEWYSFLPAEYKNPGPRVELNRTESAAFADELFNPHNYEPASVSTSTLPPPSSNHNLLSPHRNLIDERLRTANSIRSHSPVNSMSRERSPFRQGSPLAPSPGPFLGTAADARRQQRDEASAREWATHQPKLRRETTKTMSPKDALLEFNDPDQGSDTPLFSDSMPQTAYNKQFATSEAFENAYNNQSFTNMAAPQQTNLGAFRASEQASPNTTTFNFLPPPPAPLPPNPYAPPQYRSTNNFTEATPDFPAHLASMESSVSEGPAPSSQGSMTSAPMPMTKPLDTHANTGTYTCSIPGCTQRFDAAAKLQRHKRESHGGSTHSAAHSARDSLSSAGSASPSRSVSPDNVGSKMTSAALAERNSQQGPHKCSRVNPSTGKPCNTIFSRPYDLTRHEDTIHNRLKQKVRCQYCREEKTFSRNDALTRHMRVVHPEVDFQGKRGRRGENF